MMTANNPNASKAKDAQARFIVVLAAGSFNEGDVIPQASLGALETNGGIALPFQPELAARSGIGGYFKRSFGGTANLHAVQSKPVAKVVIFLDPKYSQLHWVARLEITPAWADRMTSKPGRNSNDKPTPADRLTGSVRMLPDGTQESPMRCICTPQGKQWEAREVVIGNLDKDLGLIVRGMSTVGVAQPGNYPFALYGFGDGIRVAWVAVSQA